jgi:hypothetical protein
MDIARVDQVLLILLPTFAIGALLSLPNGVTPLWRLVRAATMLPGSPLIMDRAIQSACPLRLPHPDRPVRNSLARPELRRLLHTVPEAGLVLPPAVNLSAPNGRQSRSPSRPQWAEPDHTSDQNVRHQTITRKECVGVHGRLTS